MTGRRIQEELRKRSATLLSARAQQKMSLGRLADLRFVRSLPRQNPFGQRVVRDARYLAATIVFRGPLMRYQRFPS
jgi:hypothetical protein